jgi:hypothetical protein
VPSKSFLSTPKLIIKKFKEHKAEVAKLRLQYLFQQTIRKQKYSPKIKMLCLCGLSLIHMGLNEITVTRVPFNHIVNIFQIFKFLQKFQKCVGNTVARCLFF